MKKIYALLISVICSYGAKAQLPENVKAEIEIQAIGTTPGTVPFWMRSNQYGSVPLSGASGSVVGRYVREYKFLNESPSGNDRNHLFDFGYGAEIRANGGKNSNIQIIEAYTKAKAWIFQLKAGRSKDVMGLNGDTALSSGNFSISGNALGIPKIDLSIPNYYRIPFLDGIFSVKGNFSHGWLGRIRVYNGYQAPNATLPSIPINVYPKTYFHEKSLYVKVGKKDWRLSLTGGFSHQAFWGNEKETLGPNFLLSPVQTFFYVATGKAYGSNGIATSKIGNQLGSIDMGISYEFNDFTLSIYRQNFYDVGALSKLANIRDGLNGISVRNSNYDASDERFQIKSILVELFYSKDQAGYPWSIPTASGDEDYYNNYFYRDGWSYKKLGLGNPFITPRYNAREGQAFSNFDYFINNRVVAVHTGLSGSFSNLIFNTKLSYSQNYGTFGTSIYGKSTGSEYTAPAENPFVPVNQLSGSISIEKYWRDGYILGLGIYADNGKLLNKSFGTTLRVLKRFN